MLNGSNFESPITLVMSFEHVPNPQNSNSSAGGEDLYLGFKIALTPQDGVLPETALVLQTTVASGDDVFSSGDANPGLNYIYSWALDDEWSLAGQTQWNRAVDGDTGRPYSEFSQSVAIERVWTINSSLLRVVLPDTRWQIQPQLNIIWMVGLPIL